MTLTPEILQKQGFVNLNTHSHFSIPFGVGKPKDHFKHAMKVGHKGFALTDISSMGGCLETVKMVKEKKFPFILGAELNMIDSLENKDKVNKFFNITCYVKDFMGYKNLVRLISDGGKEDHFYYKPRISLEELIDHKDGLIITSGNIYGMISQAIIKETGQEELLIEIFKEHFGEDFYIQLNYHPKNMEFDRLAKKWKDTGYDAQKMVNIRLIELSKKYDIKCFITQNSFMPEKKNKIQQNILLGNNEQFKTSNYTEYHTYDLKSVEDMYNEVQTMSPYITDELFLEYCQTTVDILEKCKDLKLKFKPELPKIIYSENDVNIDPKYDIMFEEHKIIVQKVCPKLYDMFVVAERDIALKTSLKVIIKYKKMDFRNEVYASRLAYELEVIQRNGVIQLLDYFLLLEDVTSFVRNAGFLRGYGRGSGAGSLLAYTLDITDCDPIFYNLLFERFLTLERIGKYLVDHPEFAKDSLDIINFDELLA